MASILSGENGIPSFEEWRKTRGGTAASRPEPTAAAKLSGGLLDGGNGVPCFEEWRKLKHADASPVLSEVKKGIFDTSGKSYADTAGLPLWNREEIDNGAQRKTEQLKAAAERLSKAPEWTDEEMKTLNQATALRRSGQRAEADALDSPIRNARRENAQRNKAIADKLKEQAYYTEQAGIRTVSEKLAQSDPEYLSKAAAGYEDKTNPIQKQREKLMSNLPAGADNGVMGATLDEQLSKIAAGEKNGAVGTGLMNGMGGVNPADLTADELKTYSYWYQKSPNAAKRYLESISADVNRRTSEREAQFYAENSRELRDRGIGTTALALGRDLMVDYASPAAFVSAAAAKLSGKPYDPNSSVNRLVTNSAAMQEGLTGDLSGFGKFLADTGISTAQYLSRIPLGAAGLVVMASGAAGKTANEVKRNGGTTDQALTLGTVAGLAEYATEKIPFENIKAAFGGGEKKALAGALEKAMRSKLGSVVGSAAEEGIEEVVSEYINNIANDAVLGDASDMKKYALELISQGMSYEDATKAAFKQFYVTNPFVAFAGGALSGGVMAGAGETWANRRNIPRAIVNAGEENLRTQMQKNQAGSAEIQADNKAAGTAADMAAGVDMETEKTVAAKEEPQVMPKNQLANPTGNIVLDTAEQASRKQRANAAKTDVERSGILAGASDADIAIAKSLSEVFGRKIIFDSTDATVNGKFSDGTIYVNPDGSDNVVTILAHELTHSAEGTEEYNTLKRCLMKNLSDRGVMWSTILDDVRGRYEFRYKRMGQEFTDSDCESEALALAAQALFNDSSSMQEFVRQNRSAASRLWHKVSQAVERLKQDLSYRFGRGEKDSEARKRQLAVRQLEDARDALAKALRATEKTARMSGNQSDGVKYSQAVDQDFLDFIRECESSTDGKVRRYNISDVSERQAQELKKLTGEDFSGYRNSINSDAINHIKKRHGENGEHDTTMSDDLDIARIGYIIRNFDSVDYVLNAEGNIATTTALSDKNGRPSAMVAYKKNIGNTQIVVQAVADNKYKKLWVISSYITNKENGVTQATDVLSLDRTPDSTSENALASPPSDNSISQSTGNVNSSGEKRSLNDSQYGTKALNTAEELNRTKALAMLKSGKDPEYVFELTGWFYDNFGTLMVDHGAEMYSYGENEIDSKKSAKSEVKKQEKKPKSEQLGTDALREAYRLGEREAQRLIAKAMRTQPDMMPDAKFVKGIVDEITGDNVSEKKKREFGERLTELYDRIGDADSNGVAAMSQSDIADAFNKLATDILDSRQYVDGERERIQKDLKKEFKTPMFVSPTARGDFAEGWNNVRKAYFGKMNLTSDRAKGVPVDVRYMELNEAYPDWFPDRITNETEQLELMMQLCDRVFDKNFAVESYYNFSGWENEYKKDHADIITKLSNGYSDLKRQPRTWYDEFVKRLNDYRENTARIHESEIKKIVEAAEKDAEEQLARYEQLMIETQKQNTERENEIREYYEGREQDRIDKENRARAERDAKRRRRGGEIDMTRLSEALGDNTFTDKMKKLWEAQKKLSKEVEKYADVDLETITDADLKKHIENIRERLDDMNAYINRIGQAVRRIKRRTALETIAKGDIMKWVDKKSGYLYSRETTRRNIEDISNGDELGKEIIKEYIDPIQRDVALSTRFKETLRHRVKALDLGMKPTGNNKLSESAFVQLLGEARDNIYMLEHEQGADVRIGGERVREGKTLSEWQAILDTLMAENSEMDMDKINNAITEFQNIYDELFELINNVRVLNGYAPADYHHGYFPHYNNDAGTDGIISSLFTGLGFDLDTEGLPTSINGLTHVFRPGTKYMSNLKQRSVYGVGEQYNGFTLNSGAVEGFDRYIETAADVIFLTGDIQNLRALSDAIRYSTTEEGVRNQVDSIREDWKLTAQEQDSLIAELYSGKQKFHLRNFVIDLEEYTNLLAGKKSIKDRQWEQNFGRGMYQVMKKVEQRITANQIALNPGSWLTNFVPLAQAGSVLTPRQMLGAMLDTIKATMNDDGFATRSDFLTNRRGSDSLVKTGAQKFQDAMSKPMELIDGFTSETIVRARYAQNLKKGMTESEAMHEADIFTNKLMANRAKGDMPTLFYSVNPVSKLFTMYQLEVNNQWSFMFKDLPKEAKDAGKNLAAMLFKLCIGSWLYNEIYEMIVGRRCAFDPLNMLNDFAGDLTGYKLPSVSKALDTAFNPEKIDELFKAKKVGVTNAAVNLGKNAIEEAPFFGGIIGGGRIPISNALPNFGNFISSFDYSSEKASSKRWEMRLKEGAKPLFYMLPPYGGGQIKKAIEGAAAFAQGGSYIRDNEGKKQLQYPIENQTVGQVAMNLPRALLFGKTANKYGREWIDNGFGKYSAKATEAYQALVDDGISQADALKAVDEIKGEEKRAGKVKALREIGGSSEAKRAVFEKMILSSDDAIEAAAEKLDSIDSAGISFDSYLDVYDTYLTVSGDMRKLDVISTINRMKLSESQKDVLYCCFYKEGGLADTPWHSNGVMKAVLPEIGLPDITLPEIKMPEIKMPEINLPGLK